jgi:hypothetical protein
MACIRKLSLSSAGIGKEVAIRENGDNGSKAVVKRPNNWQRDMTGLIII